MQRSSFDIPSTEKGDACKLIFIHRWSAKQVLSRGAPTNGLATEQNNSQDMPCGLCQGARAKRQARVATTLIVALFVCVLELYADSHFWFFTAIQVSAGSCFASRLFS